MNKTRKEIEDNYREQAEKNVKSRLVLEAIIKEEKIEASQEEVAFVNSLRIDKCPYCDGTHFKKDGHRKDGMQKYFCNDCKHSFIHYQIQYSTLGKYQFQNG